MRRIMLGLLALVLAGCGVELLTTTAIQGELQAEQVKAMKRQLGAAGNQAAKIRIQNAINMYWNEKEAYPALLDDLVPDYLPSVPTKPDGQPYNYDPYTGTLLDGPVPERSDTEKLWEIRDAIDSYGYYTGYYPRTLDDLVPEYLETVPTAANGRAFVYDMETAEVYPPASRRQPRQPARTPGGGAGPMGEVMTGIAIQSELNSMSNAGSSAAAGRSRQNLRNNSQTYQQKQEQALDELGF